MWRVRGERVHVAGRRVGGVVEVVVGAWFVTICWGPAPATCRSVSPPNMTH